MESGPLQRLAASLSGKKILVIGDVMLDEYIVGESKRFSPEAPVPVVEVQTRTCRPGGAANVAANVAALGSMAILAGAVGTDEAAERLMAELDIRGIETSGIIADPDRPTTTKTRIIANQQQLVRLDWEEKKCLPSVLGGILLKRTLQQLSKADACIVSDYAKGVVSSRLAGEVISQARNANKPVIVDPNGADYTLYRGATVLKPNQHEVERFIDAQIPDTEALTKAGHKMALAVPGSALLITRGAEGMLLFQEGSEPRSFPTHARDVNDPTGAGDTVAAVLALALASGAKLEQSVRLASSAAGIAVGKAGPATVSIEELLNEVS